MIDLESIEARVTRAQEWNVLEGSVCKTVLAVDVPALVAEVRRLRVALIEIAPSPGVLRCGSKPFKDGSCSPACVACELAEIAAEALRT